MRSDLSTSCRQRGLCRGPYDLDESQTSVDYLMKKTEEPHCKRLNEIATKRTVLTAYTLFKSSEAHRGSLEVLCHDDVLPFR